MRCDVAAMCNRRLIPDTYLNQLGQIGYYIKVCGSVQVLRCYPLCYRRTLKAHIRWCNTKCTVRVCSLTPSSSSQSGKAFHIKKKFSTWRITAKRTVTYTRLWPQRHNWCVAPYSGSHIAEVKLCKFFFFIYSLFPSLSFSSLLYANSSFLLHRLIQIHSAQNETVAEAREAYTRGKAIHMYVFGEEKLN